MSPAFVLAYPAKVAAVWTIGVLAAVADVQLFDPSSLFGSAGLAVTAVLTFFAIYRTNANRELRTLATARGDRIADLETERDRARAEAKEQRDLKHQALAELAAEKKIRDLQPVLEGLIELQKGQTSRAEVESRMAEALEAQTRTLEDAVERIGAHGDLLGGILAELKHLRQNGG